MDAGDALSAVDAMFLDLEDASAHMHVGGVLVLEGDAPTPAALAAHVGARLHRVPRYRQRLAFPPLAAGRPRWVDDPAFDLRRHLGQRAVAPGGAALDAAAADFLGRRLARDRPLWALELVTGFAPGRFALLSRTHHALLDGIGGVDFLAAITDDGPAPPKEAPPPWAPRPPPGAGALLAAAARDRLAATAALLGGPNGGLRELARGAAPLAGLGLLGPVGGTSLSRPIGPDRRWEALSLDLGEVGEVRSRLGGTVNDVLLAVVAGALRTLLLSRGEPVPGELRVFVPVNVRPPEARGTYGNRVAFLLCPVPVGEADPSARLARVAEATRAAKSGGQLAGVLALERLGDLALPPVAAGAIRALLALRTFDLVVSSIPGPRAPRWMLGRKVLAAHPAIPLAQRQTISVGALGYAGSLDLGLLGDARGAPDLPVLAAALRTAAAELVAAARARAPEVALGAPVAAAGHAGARRRAPPQAGVPAPA